MSVRDVLTAASHQCFDDQPRTWMKPRTGWSALLVLFVVVIAGLLGAGLLNSSYAQGTNNDLDVKYNLFTRYHSLSTFQIHVRPGAAKQGKVRLYLNQGFIENIDLRKIDPQPESVVVSLQSMVYTFRVPEGSKPFNITYQFEPNIHGRQAVAVSIQDGPGVTFNQLILP